MNEYEYEYDRIVEDSDDLELYEYDDTNEGIELDTEWELYYHNVKEDIAD